jgi:hypothetical protein
VSKATIAKSHTGSQVNATQTPIIDNPTISIAGKTDPERPKYPAIIMVGNRTKHSIIVLAKSCPTNNETPRAVASCCGKFARLTVSLEAAKTGLTNRSRQAKTRSTHVNFNL